MLTQTASFGSALATSLPLPGITVFEFLWRTGYAFQPIEVQMNSQTQTEVSMHPGCTLALG